MLTQKQIHLLDEVNQGQRGKSDSLLTQMDVVDATACSSAGLLNVLGDGTATITDAGRHYLYNLNRIKDSNTRYAASIKQACAITNQDVINAFDALGGTANQVQALHGYLEKDMASNAAVIAINNALADGVLVINNLGSVRKA